MRSRLNSWILALLLAGIATALLHPPIIAQALPDDRMSVVLVIVDTLPALDHEYEAVILRRSDVEPRDLILLTEAASPEALDSAVRTLLRVRADQGERSDAFRGRSFTTLTIGVRPSQASPAWSDRYLARAAFVLDAALSGKPRYIPGLGTYRAVEFLPPALRRGGPAPRG